MLDELPPCGCRIHAPPLASVDLDESDRKLLDDVNGHGWHLVGINPRPGQPSWVFSVGLWHTFRSPELSMFGLQMRDMGVWLNRVGDQVKEGRPPRPDELRADVIEGFNVQWRPVHESWYRDLFGYGLWFYQGWFPMLEVIWPDRDGRWPWDEDCGARCRADQPRLWCPADEHPLGQWRYGVRGLEWRWPDEPERRVFVTKRTVEDEVPIVLVVHEVDGDWQFLDGGPLADDVAVAHLGDIVSQHPQVEELHDLPRGWQAWRRTRTDEWHREASPT